MKHRIGFNRLERRQGHRKALKNNMVTSLFRYERVETTKVKAQEVRRVAEKLVTRARVDSVHNRRIVGERIHDGEVLAKLFTEIAPRYLERPGGYTRILKIGRRQGDAAEMVILELVDRVVEEKSKARAEKQKEAPAERGGAPAEERSARESARSASGSARSEAATVPEETEAGEAAAAPEESEGVSQAEEGDAGSAAKPDSSGASEQAADKDPRSEGEGASE